MIPPAESLLKYGNPILVNKHSGKKSPKVSLSQDSTDALILILNKQSVYLFLRDEETRKVVILPLVIRQLKITTKLIY